MDFKEFKCTIHSNVLNQEFLTANPGLLAEAYTKPEAMAKVAGCLAGDNKALVSLPFDCMLEAEALGAKIVGHDDMYGLRTAETLVDCVSGLAALPSFDYQAGRPKAVLQAIKILKAQGYTPCLNISGFFAVGGLLMGAEKLFAAWHQDQQALLNFFDWLRLDLLGYIEAAFKAGAKVISYSDSLAHSNLVGPKMADGIATLLLLPFFEELKTLPSKGIIHLCGLNSIDFDLLPQVQTKVINLPQAMAYNEAIASLANRTQKIEVYGFGCLNHKRQTKEVYQFDF